VLRLVTNLVLTISDLDVFFSVLFLKELQGCWKYGLQYAFLFVLIVFGWFTYLLAVCYFGPRQRFEVMKLVCDRMEKYPQEFTTPCFNEVDGRIVARSSSNFKEGVPHRVDFGDFLSPVQEPQSSANKFQDFTFQLLLDDEDSSQKEKCDQFRLAMEKWGLAHVWGALAMSNAKKCLEVYHGTPFIRIAKYGFNPQPTVADLGGLLNANAVYSFATGIIQLISSVLMITNFGSTILRTIPAILSGVSFILCMANVIGDFPAKLEAIEMEEEQYKRIIAENGKKRLAEITANETRCTHLEEQIEKEYASKALRNSGGQLTAAQEQMRETALGKVMVQREKGRTDADRKEMRLLEIEIEGWRQKLQNERDLIAGRKVVEQLHEGSEADNLRRLNRKLEMWYENEMNKLEEFIGTDQFVSKIEELRKRKEQQHGAIFGSDSVINIATCDA